MTKEYDERCKNGENIEDTRNRLECVKCKRLFLWLVEGGLCEDCWEKVR